MNKKLLIEAVAKELSISKKEAEHWVNAFINATKKVLKREGSLWLKGLGLFLVKRRKARRGVNPKTAMPVRIKASKTVVFRAVKDWERNKNAELKINNEQIISNNEKITPKVGDPIKVRIVSYEDNQVVLDTVNLEEENTKDEFLFWNNYQVSDPAQNSKKTSSPPKPLEISAVALSSYSTGQTVRGCIVSYQTKYIIVSLSENTRGKMPKKESLRAGIIPKRILYPEECEFSFKIMEITGTDIFLSHCELVQQEMNPENIYNATVYGINKKEIYLTLPHNFFGVIPRTSEIKTSNFLNNLKIGVPLNVKMKSLQNNQIIVAPVL